MLSQAGAVPRESSKTRRKTSLQRTSSGTKGMGEAPLNNCEKTAIPRGDFALDLVAVWIPVEFRIGAHPYRAVVAQRDLLLQVSRVRGFCRVDDPCWVVAAA